ncbi:MAG TPA: hypothetical protein VEF04_05035, partial [Blastocatellia bacterium]|nr:hypothetical protein [Blastocatellia bacterium]
MKEQAPIQGLNKSVSESFNPCPPMQAQKQPRGNKEAQIFAEQVRLLHVNSFSAISFLILLVGLVTFALWKVVPIQRLLICNAILATISLARLFLIKRYLASKPNIEESKRWHSYFEAGVAVLSLTWGLGVVFIVPVHSVAHQNILLLILGGISIGAASSLSPVLRTFFIHITLLYLPMNIWLLSQGDETHLTMWLLSLLFTVMPVATAVRANKTIANSLRLQLENAELVEDLSASNRAKSEFL